MRRIASSIVAVVVLCSTVVAQDPGFSQSWRDASPCVGIRGFPFTRAPACSPAVLAAFRTGAPAEIARVAREGGWFSCGYAELPLLASAIDGPNLPLVAALLDAGADPNVRWGCGGEFCPLQLALDRFYFKGDYRQSKVVALLLAKGANPNARGCLVPLEGGLASGNLDQLPGCDLPKGVLSLTVATFYDEIPNMRLLLDAGADPNLTDSKGRSALCTAHSEAALALLVAKMFPGQAAPKQAALARMEECGGPTDGPWMETELTRALMRWPFPFTPPVVPPGHPDYHPYTNDPASDSRIDVPLRLGADPNRRLTKRADWTPLAIALASDRDPALLAATLLKFGADPNARWCNAMHWFGNSRLSPVTERPAGCSASTGTTPLILAASRCDAQEVTTLLEHGANATLRDWTGRTARDYAKSCKGNVLAAFPHGR